MHIDVARNATDDFNLFHDKRHWHEIQDNPFAGPIALGFQQICFIENSVKQYRKHEGEEKLIDEHRLDFSNYAINFANVVKPDERLSLEIKKSTFSVAKTKKLSNRIVLRNNAGIVLIGFKSESDSPLYLSTSELPKLPDLNKVQDRSELPSAGFFYKRKFTTNSNAKNFLTASNVEQSDYFDEINNHILFPETYCTGMISCALLERATFSQHDFKRDPMVYTSQKLSVNRRLVAALRSDQKIHLLVSPPQNTDKGMVVNRCYGLNQTLEVLFQGEIELAPLSVILGQLN